MHRLIIVFAFALFCAGPAQAQLDQTPWHLEVEWEIGGEESEVFLSYPNDLAIGFDNQIYLSDRREPGITVFSRSGKEVMTIGREGQGPGEFSEVTSMLAMPEGGVLVHDQRNNRMSQFNSVGELVRTIKITGVTEGRNWLAAYDEATDRLAVVKEMSRGATDEPLIYWVDLGRERLGDGVLRPSELIDLSDPVYAFSAMSTLTYSIDAFSSLDGGSELVLFPAYYTGAWSSVSFNDGNLGRPVIHHPSDAVALNHASILDITQEEMRAADGKYGNAFGYYTQEGVYFADIHNWAQSGVSFNPDTFGIFFVSEESGMDGFWIDVFSVDGELLGRHPILHDLKLSKDSQPRFLVGTGPDEVYIRYRDREGNPIIVQGRLVPEGQ
jgi:hypothetical protein